tara:strand:+ start:1248 stop:2006 length:759 start_codon:yes stop_codon:yes gene_type:complete
MTSKISVIIPSYNNFIFFERCISSVINQTYKNIEIIIIFDHGNKKDLKTLKSILKKKQKKIKLIINSKNLGAGLSRNKAAKLAKGKYIAFLDSDDVWTRNKLKHQLAFMKKRKITISHTSYYIIDENDVKIGSQIAKYKQTYQNLLNSCDIGLSSLMIEKNLFLRNKFTSNKTKEDYASWLKIAKKMDIYGLNKPLLLWRKTRNSLSSNTTQKVIDAFDIYYRKERFNFLNSTYRVIILSFNYFMKKLKQKL